MNKPLICHITTVHNAFDNRIFKQCVSTANKGFNVILSLCREQKTIMLKVKIISLPKFRNRLKHFLVSIYSAFKNSIKLNAKAYHFHDPELIF